MASTPGPDMQEPHHDQVLNWVEQFVSQNTKPFVQTTDVAEQFQQVSKRTVYKRLKDLHEREELERRDVGANSTVWWPKDQDRV